MSIFDLEALCYYFKIRMYACDLNLESLHVYDPLLEHNITRHGGSKYRNLMFVLADKHMYPITDKKTRDVLERNHNPNKHKGAHYAKTKKVEEDDEDDELEELATIYSMEMLIVPKKSKPRRYCWKG